MFQFAPIALFSVARTTSKSLDMASFYTLSVYPLCFINIAKYSPEPSVLETEQSQLSEPSLSERCSHP